MNNKVLVTGGAGFVGSGLVRQLLAKDYEVVVLDNLVRGSRDNLPSVDQLTFVEGDIRSDSDMNKALAENPGSVVHLAAHHFIPYCNDHPGETINVNVFGTQVVIDAICRSECVEKLVFASTAAVYAPADEPHREDEQPGPIDIYGISKNMGEDLVNFFRARTKIPAVSARLFNVVGPRETNPHLIPDIVDQLPLSGPLQLGNLLPKRDYIHVNDIADGFIALLENDAESSALNIGSGESHSASDVVAVIADITGQPIEIDSIPEKQRTGDRPNLCADTAALTNLGWSCENDLRQALTDTMRFYGKI